MANKSVRIIVRDGICRKSVHGLWLVFCPILDPAPNFIQIGLKNTNLMGYRKPLTMLRFCDCSSYVYSSSTSSSFSSSSPLPIPLPPPLPPPLSPPQNINSSLFQFGSYFYRHHLLFLHLLLLPFRFFSLFPSPSRRY